MRERTFHLLAAATIAAVAAAAYAVVSAERGRSPPVPNRPALPELASQLGDLAWMRLIHGGTTADFTAVAGRWVVVEKDNYPAAPDKMRRLLLGLADLTLIEPKTRRPELFARLDLDDPENGRSTLIRLQNRIGAAVGELVVGKLRCDRFGGGSDGIYVRRPGDDQTWLARGSLELPADLDDWLDRRLIDLAPSRVASVTLTGADGVALVLRRDAPGGRFAIVEAPRDATFKPDTLLAGPAAALAGLEFEDVRPAAELPVPENGVATGLFLTFDGLAVTTWVFTHDDAEWLTIEAMGNDAAAAEAKAIDRRVGRWTYKIRPDRAKLLRTRLGDLVEPAKG